MKYISPSLLGFNVDCIKEQIKQFKNTKISSIHYDVMDNIYVKNTSFNLEHLSYIDSLNIKIDVHLMCTNVIKWVKKYIPYNVRSISIHPDADDEQNIQTALSIIKNTNKISPGLALKNNQDLYKILDLLKQVNYVIVMGVNPGFGGQKYLKETTEFLKKLNDFKKIYKLDFFVILDGGFNDEILEEVKNYADIFVSGSFLMKQKNFISYSDDLFKKINF